MSGKQLAMTGSGVITVGGVAIAGPWILAGAVVLVLLGAVAIRLSFRRRRGAGQ